MVDTGLSDHQLVYCTRKITRIKLNVHKYIKTRSLQNYSQALYQEELRKIYFPDYSNFKDMNDAYSDFTETVTSAIDEIVPLKEIRVKNNSQDWFDAEINEEIERRDNSFAKFKSPGYIVTMKTVKSTQQSSRCDQKQKKNTLLLENFMKILGNLKNFGNC